jgi:probable rRNA maturation factor
VIKPTTRANDIIAIDITAEGWRTALAGEAAVQKIAAEAAAAALAAVGPPEAVEISVRLAGDADIRTLNHEYRGRNAATNVLSFALSADDEPKEMDLAQLEGAPKLLGDVVTAYETCAGEAEDQAKPLADHLRHMVVHGVLHLLGYDHETADEAEHMEGLERDILARLGVPDPYARAAA